MKNFPPTFNDLLQPETKAYAYLATLMPDGSPQVTPLWFNTDDDYILLNTAVGRVKDRNMRARTQVAVLLQNPAEPYRYLQIRGVVAERQTEGADEHINQLALKYTGKPWQPVPNQQRVTYKIKALHFDQH